MKSVIIISILLISFAVMVPQKSAYAQCPRRANSLAAFASCMVPMSDGQGTVAKSSVNSYGIGEAGLMAVMNSAPVVPNYAYASYPYYGVWNPMTSVASIKSSHSNFWAWWSLSRTPYYGGIVFP